jgi:hypothetical protein
MLVEKIEAAIAQTNSMRNCRERALVITKLEEAMLWATRMPDRYAGGLGITPGATQT